MYMTDDHENISSMPNTCNRVGRALLRFMSVLFADPTSPGPTDYRQSQRQTIAGRVGKLQRICEHENPRVAAVLNNSAHKCTAIFFFFY